MSCSQSTIVILCITGFDAWKSVKCDCARSLGGVPDVGKVFLHPSSCSVDKNLKFTNNNLTISIFSLIHASSWFNLNTQFLSLLFLMPFSPFFFQQQNNNFFHTDPHHMNPLHTSTYHNFNHFLPALLRLSPLPTSSVGHAICTNDDRTHQQHINNNHKTSSWATKWL